jgi:hypothetical protein
MVKLALDERKVMINGFIFEDSDYYHQQSDKNLSSHQLMDYIRSPYVYWWKRNCKERTDSPSYFLGRAIHQYVLEGSEVFHQNYSVGGPINEKTGKPFGPTSQKYQDWLTSLQESGKVGISTDDYDVVLKVNEAIDGHIKAKFLLSDGFPEAVVRARYCNVDCQIRIDWYNKGCNSIVDLKTCRNIDRFPYDFKDFMYANQMAFYRGVFYERFGFNPGIYLIVAEVVEPCRVGVFHLCELTLNDAQYTNELTIPEFIESKKTGVYPTKYEQIKEI